MAHYDEERERDMTCQQLRYHIAIKGDRIRRLQQEVDELVNEIEEHSEELKRLTT